MPDASRDFCGNNFADLFLGFGSFTAQMCKENGGDWIPPGSACPTARPGNSHAPTLILLDP